MHQSFAAFSPRTAARPFNSFHRLVAAKPVLGGERGSPPRTGCVVGTAPHGCRGTRGACRRHLAARDRAECRTALRRRGGSSTSPTRPTRAPPLLGAGRRRNDACLIIRPAEQGEAALPLSLNLRGAASPRAGNCRDRTPSSTDNGFATSSLRRTPPSMDMTVSRSRYNSSQGQGSWPLHWAQRGEGGPDSFPCCLHPSCQCSARRSSCPRLLPLARRCLSNRRHRATSHRTQPPGTPTRPSHGYSSRLGPSRPHPRHATW